MARLADLLWTWNVMCPEPLAKTSPAIQQALLERFVQVRDSIAANPVIVADNVCEYFFAGTEQEEWVYESDFPCCAPPFERFFIEMKRPSVVFSEEPGPLKANDLPQMWGCYCEGMPREDAGDEFMNELLTAVDADDIQTVRDNCRWVLTLSIIIGQKGVVLPPWLIVVFFIDADGAILANPVHIFDGTSRADSANFGQFRHMAAILVMPALLTVSFMNCKNVAVQNNEPRSLTPREVKAGQRPWVKFKTLDISPMKRVLRTEGNEETVGLRRALHICRGHFARYSEEKPLFGKVAGQFWIPAHVRGSAGRGVVVKDYKVKPV